VAGTTGQRHQYCHRAHPALDDGGQTYNTVLNSGTANDGSENVTLPGTAVAQARIMVQAVGNFFFDISNNNFAIADISLPPATPTLQAASDTGPSQTDGITKRNNSSPANALTFDIGATVPGATVSIYDGNTLLGQAVASGTTTAVTTNGTTTLSDGVHVITARQTEVGKPESSPSDPINITIDTVAPQLAGTPSFEFSTGTHFMQFSFNENLGIGVSDGSLVLHNNSTNSNVPAHVTYTPNTATFDFPALPNAKIPDGSYSATLTATDLAGNTVTSSLLPYNFIYVGGTVAHTIYLQRGGSGSSQVEVFKDTLPDGTPDFVADYATLSQVALEGSNSDDTVTVDFINGDPVPPGFLAFRYLGGAGNDTFNVKNNGTFFFDTDPAADTASLSLNVSDGARVEMGAIRVHLNALNVTSNGSLQHPRSRLYRAAGQVAVGQRRRKGGSERQRPDHRLHRRNPAGEHRVVHQLRPQRRHLDRRRTDVHHRQKPGRAQYDPGRHGRSRLQVHLRPGRHLLQRTLRHDRHPGEVHLVRRHRLQRQGQLRRLRKDRQRLQQPQVRLAQRRLRRERAGQL
jgi:hypothetical protein